MIVLLQPQGFTDTPRGKTQIQSSLYHSQAVSQLEYGMSSAVSMQQLLISGESIIRTLCALHGKGQTLKFNVAWIIF